MSLNTTPATFAASEIVTSVKMNTEIRDALTGVQAAWDAYTPTWGALTTAPVLGNGTIVGAYRRIGKTIDFRIFLTMGSTTTYGAGAFTFTLPFSLSTASYPGSISSIGDAILDDSSVPTRLARIAVVNTASTIRLADPNVNVSATVPFTFATGDHIHITGRYEAA